MTKGDEQMQERKREVLQEYFSSIKKFDEIGGNIHIIGLRHGMEGEFVHVLNQYLEFYRTVGQFGFNKVKKRVCVLCEGIMYRPSPYKPKELDALRGPLAALHWQSKLAPVLQKLASLADFNGLELPGRNKFFTKVLLHGYEDEGTGFRCAASLRDMAKFDDPHGPIAMVHRNHKNQIDAFLKDAPISGPVVYGRNKQWLFSLVGSSSQSNLCIIICGGTHITGRILNSKCVNRDIIKKGDTKYGLRKMIQQDPERRFKGFRLGDFRVLSSEKLSGYSFPAEIPYYFESYDHGVIR